jgi:predicted transcriptional regulator
METKEKILNYLEMDPEIYKIINSKEHMLILKEIYKTTTNIDDLFKKTDFKKLSILYNILDNLLVKKFISKVNLDKNELYYITDKGKEFIGLYEKAKKDFDLI